MKSLVVEDDPICSRILKSILSCFGACSTAWNGAEAVSAYKKSLQDDDPFELICMDIMMPTMDGHQALHVIRNIEREQNIPQEDAAKVIIATCRDDEEDKQQAYHAGCNAYMVKPIQRNSLHQQIKNLGLTS